MIMERDGKFFLVTKQGSVEYKPDGRHCIEETIEKEITELEYLRYKVRELQGDIAVLKNQSYPVISYPVVCPCPCPRDVPVVNPCPPWINGQPLWYVDPNLQPTYTCDTLGSTSVNSGRHHP